MENDVSFDYDTFMALAKGPNGVLPYAQRIFIELYRRGHAEHREFAYNNIVWRILVDQFHTITGVKVQDVLKASVPGLTFKTDTKGFIHGLNGMNMTCSVAFDYARWAEVILRQNRRWMLLYPAISRKQEYWGNLFGKDYNVHPFYGWFVAAHVTSPNEPVAAVSVGFMSQFICIDMTNEKREPAVQLRKVYWQPGDNPAIHNFAREWVGRSKRL